MALDQPKHLSVGVEDEDIRLENNEEIGLKKTVQPRVEVQLKASLRK